MAINFNSYPYYDDYDPNKNFYKVLFKPGYAVQARELNQLQSISQHQISSFANHIFKKNSMVIPGGIVLNTKADMLFTLETNPDNFIGKTITNAPLTEGVYNNYETASTFEKYITAVILGYKEATDVFPACFYIKYFNSYRGESTTQAGFESDPPRMKFISTDLVYTIESNPRACLLNTIEPITAIGKVASIDKGVFYTKELFVDVYSQNIIVEQDNNIITNAIIGLSIEESIIDYTTDNSLLDNAQGYPNQYAPGADRYKVELILNRIDNNTPINDEKFIQLMTIENDVITYLNNNSQYAELMKTLAKRTYDANGNFIVNGLKPVVNKSNNDDYIWASVGKGSCYLGGYEYNQLSNVNIPISKPRNDHTVDIPEVSTYSDDMPYFYVAGGTYGANLPLLTYIPEKNEIIKFISSSNIQYVDGDETIGYGVFKELQLYTSSVTNSIYKMFFTNITIETGKNIENIGGYVKIGTSTNEGAPILREYTVSTTDGFDYSDDNPNYFNNPPSTLQVSFSGELVINNVVPYGALYYDTPNKLYTIKIKGYNLTVSNQLKLPGGPYTDYFSSFVTNFQNEFYPMIKVDNNTIKTIKDINGNYTLSYSIIESYEFTPTTDSHTINLIENDIIFEDFSINDYALYNKTDNIFEPLTNTSITFAPTFKTLYVDTTALHNKSLILYTTIIKENVPAVTNNTIENTIYIDTPTSSWIALGHQNVQGIVSVIDSGDINIPANDQASADVDITNRYILNSGATATEINTGCIKLKRNCIPPVGQISITYTYIPATTGFYSCVDSYVGNNVGDLSYIGNIKDVYDSKKNLVNIRNYLDFRPTFSNYLFKNYGKATINTSVIKLKDINLSYYHAFYSSLGNDANLHLYLIGPGCENGRAIQSAAIVSGNNDTEITIKDYTFTQTYSGIYYIGLSHTKNLIDTTTGTYGLGRDFTYPKDLARITYSYTKFTPKHIHLYINREQDNLSIQHKEVNSFQEILQYRRDEYKLPLAYIYMEPYTIGINEVRIENFENPVYKMLDIHDIKERVDRNEYYTSLALNKDMHQEILDASVEGFTESARGMWNEDFEDAFSQDYNSPDFKCTIYDKSYVAPGTVTRTINLVPSNTEFTGNYKVTGSNVTLPYTEVKAFGNSPASTFNNLNPYNTINWQGKLTLNPMVDNWVDVVTSPSITKPVVIENKPNPPVIIDIITPPPVITNPPVIIPAPPVDIVEIVTEISNLKVSWGRDSRGGYHAITFDWRTNLGRTGRVNSDKHLSDIIKEKGWDGTYAKSLKNKKYNLPEVKGYLHAGTHFDKKDPSKWSNH